MSEYIHKLISKTVNKRLGGGTYILFTYEVIDELGNTQEVSSLQGVKTGTHVRVVFSKLAEKYDRPQLVVIKNRLGGTAIK